MASVVLNVVGTASFGPAGGFVGGLIGAGIDSYLFAPEGQNTQGARLDSLAIQKTSYGAALSRMHATCRIAGTVIWAEPKKEIANKTETGGKGGSSSTHTSYTYTSSFAVGFLDTEGRTFEGVRRIWADTKLIYDATGGSLDDDYQSGYMSDGIRVYIGTETQEIDPYIEAVNPDSPAFRGVAYIMFEDLEITESFGNRIPNITAEWAEDGASTSSFVQWSKTSVTSGNFVPTGAGVRDGYAYLSGYLDIAGPNPPAMRRYTLDGDEIDFRTNPPEVMHLADWIDAHSNDTSYSASLILTGEDTKYYIESFTGGNVTLTSSLFGTTFNLGSATVTPSEFVGRVYGWTHNNDGNVFIFKKYASTYVMEVWDLSPLNAGNLEIELIASVDYSSLDIGLSSYFYNRQHTSVSFGVFADANGLYVTHKNYGGGGDNSVLFYEFGDGYELQAEVNLGTRGATAHHGGADRGYIFFGEAGAGYALHKSVDSIALTDVPLSDVVGARLQACGYESADYDVTDLASDYVHGFVLDGLTSVRADIQQLQKAYHFDLVEKDWQLVGQKRGNSSSVSIQYADLATHNAGAARPEPLAISHTPEPELPRKMDFGYINQASDYEKGSQTEIRQITSSLKVTSQTAPVVLTDDEAKQALSRNFWQAWEGRMIYSDISLPVSYMYLSPGDVVTCLDQAGDSHVILLTDVELSDMTVRCKGISYNPETATSDSVGGLTPLSTRAFDWPGLHQYLTLDCPALSGVYDHGFYAAVGVINGSFISHSLLKSSDSGVTYTQSVDAFTTGAIIGYATDTLADGNPYVIDWSETVNVNTYGQNLVSVTEEAFLNGENRALLGSDGAWEVIGYQTATLESDGTYTLYGLLRGLGGTEWAMPDHAVGEYFVFLCSDNIHSINAPDADYNTDRYYLPVRNGQQISEADFVIVNTQSVRLMPMSPVHGKPVFDGSGNLTADWIPRTRFNGEWLDSVDAPLNEDSEAYEVDVVNTALTVVRTITDTATANGSVVTPASQQVYYDADDISTDSVSSPYYLYVYQLSDKVGRGQPLVITL